VAFVCPKFRHSREGGINFFYRDICEALDTIVTHALAKAMLSRWGLLVLGLLLGVAAWFYFHPPWRSHQVGPPLRSQEVELISLIERLRTERANTRENFRILPCDVSYASGPHACHSERARLGDLTIERVSFRPHPDEGAIIELERVGPNCIRLEAMASQFRGGSTSNECSHVICRYYTVNRPGNFVSFGLPESSEVPQCITSVVMNFGAGLGR
jgi:hypothetical protein